MSVVTVAGELVEAASVQIEDSGGTVINPATIENQVSMIALLTALSGVDYATETTLAALLAAFNAEDFATETTLSALNTSFQDVYDPVNSRLNVHDEQANASLDGIEDALTQAAAPDGTLRVSEFKTQFEYRFSDYNPEDVLKINGGSNNYDVGNTVGGGYFRTTNLVGSIIDAQSTERLAYSARHLMLHDGSFLFEGAPLGTGKIQAGAFTDLDGLIIEKNATDNRIILRTNGSDANFVVLGTQNGDPLDGSADSKYTQDGVPVAFDLTKFQIGQLIGSWRGVDSYDLYFLSPDKKLVLVHRFFFINTATAPSFSDPNLPMRVRIDNGDTAQVLGVQSNCWSAATNADKRRRLPTDSNSSMVALAAGALFTGGWIPSFFYDFLKGFLSADQDGRFRFDESDDGLTFFQGEWIAYKKSEGTIKLPTYQATKEFVRVVFENDSGVNQTQFSLLTYLTDIPADIPIKLLQEGIGKGDTVVPVDAVLNHENVSGVQVKTGVGDPLPTVLYEDGEAVGQANRLPVETEYVDPSSSYIEVGSSSVQLAAGTAEPRWVTVLVLPETTGLISNESGVHIGFGAGPATVSDGYYPIGSHTWKTDLRIAAIRPTAAASNVPVTIEEGVVQ